MFLSIFLLFLQQFLPLLHDDLELHREFFSSSSLIIRLTRLDLPIPNLGKPRFKPSSKTHALQSG